MKRMMRRPEFCIAAILLSAGSCLWFSTALAHPGPLDANGGHYEFGGTNYHCHDLLCIQPGPSGRDSGFFDPVGRDQRYNEDEWMLYPGSAQDCRSIRHTILVLTSKVPVTFTNPRQCEVRTGQWVDEYTGKRFEVAAQLELDHIIPRRYAHNHGGDRWQPQRKYEFSNDPMNLIMVERSEARRKRDRGPSSYLPREEYQCQYAQQWNAIAEKYRLRLAASDRNRISKILEGCGDQRSPESVQDIR